MLQFDSPSKGLLDIAAYESYFSTIPGGIFSTVTPLSSLIQYATSDETHFLPIKIYTLVSLSLSIFLFKIVSHDIWCIIYHNLILRNNI